MTPHPQRCVDKKLILEVFEELQKDTYSDIDPIDIRISTYMGWIKEGNYDCASYSSQQSEREKVLDYLDEWVNSGENLTLFKWELREVLRELRSKGGEQR